MCLQQRIIGTEVETQVFVRDARGNLQTGESAARATFELLKREPHLKQAGGYYPGIFLADGSLWYLDGQNTLEFASRECSCPFELAAVLAQELEPRLADLQRRVGGRISVGCIAYATATGEGNSRGHHQNHSLKSKVPHPDLCEQLSPSLASSVILRGGGGYDSRPEAAGLAFRLSPRACWIHAASSSSSSGSQRGLYDTWQQPLGIGARLHCLLDDYCRSSRAAVVRFGSRAAIVLLIEMGIGFRDLALQNPLSALHEFNRDPALQAQVMLKSGERVTALELEHRHWQRCTAHLELLPAWGEPLLELWKTLLDELAAYAAGGPLPVSLDWTVQYALARDLWAEAVPNVRFEDLPVFDAVAEELLTGSFRRGTAWSRWNSMKPAELEAVLERPDSIKARRFCDLGYRSDDFFAVTAMRWRLHQLAAEYFFVGEDSLYAVLEPALDHRLDQTWVPHAPLTRAAARAQAVRQFADTDADCDWTQVRIGVQRFDLSDPFMDCLARQLSKSRSGPSGILE